MLTASLICLYAAARLWRLGATCLWFDEIFSVHAARHSWGELWHFTAADLIHPPLFYALLKVWVAAGGESAWWLRLLPALASIAALVPFLLLARELRLGRAATNVALLMAATNGYLIKYAQEVRMYGLLLLFGLTSLWLCARLVRTAGGRRATLLALFVVNLLLVYTHYYGWLVVATEGAFILLRRGRRGLGGFLLGALGLALAYAPWVWACAREAGAGGGLAQNIGWITRPGARDLLQLFALFNEPFYFRQSSAEPLYARGGALLGLLVVGLPVCALLWQAARRASAPAEDGAAAAGREGHVADAAREGAATNAAREGAATGTGREDGATFAAGGDGALAFLLLFTLLPVALAFAASYVLPHSVWGTRHLIVSAGPYALLAGLAVERLRPFWWRAGAMMMLGCWFAAAGALSLASRGGDYVWCKWEALAVSAAADESKASGAPQARGARPVNLYAFEDLVAYHLWFALEAGKGGDAMRVVSVKGLPGVAEDPAYFLPRRFEGVGVARPEALGGERFWAAFRAASWDESQQPLRLILERGYRAGRTYEAGAQGQRAFLVLFVRDAAGGGE